MKVLLLASLLKLVGCGSFGLSSQEMPTYELLDHAKEICSQTLNNEVAAQTKCFPLLHNKELVIHVKKINLAIIGQGVTLAADVGARYDVYCELSQIESKKLMKNPDSIQVGLRYRVKGKFSQYEQYVEHGIFTISDCEVASLVPLK